MKKRKKTLFLSLTDDKDSYEVCGIEISRATEVVIPASFKGLPVTSIGDYAFEDCSLTSITIPSSVTSIGDEAFKDCSSLTSINYAGTMEQWKNIYSTDLEIESGVVVTCTDGTITINDFGPAMASCGGENDSSTSANAATPRGSLGLEFELSDDKDSYSVSGIGTCTDTDVVIPTRYKGLPVTSIGNHAFDGCGSLTSITIPSSVTRIGYWAFIGCSSLKSIVVDSNNSVYDSRNNCNAIIETSTNTLIAGCKNTIIPSSVTSIGNGAFDGCRSLTNITVPSSVTSIGNYAFSGCSSLTNIVVDSNNSVYDSRNNCNAIIETATNTLIAGCKSTIIPSSVTSIGDYAFDGCSSLASITIPSSVTSIGKHAFDGCGSLTSITIPSSVTSIRYSAFDGCSSLTSITIPSSVTSIESSAFNGCSSLTSIVVDSNNSVYDSRNNCNAIIETSTNTLISGCKNTIIPSSVKKIGDYALSGCSSLTSITIPSSVTSIGECAFGNCSSLTSIVVDSNNSVYDSRNNCNAIIETSTNTLISGCENTIIPSSVTSIGRSAFAECSSLTSITIPSSVRSIGDYAFDWCSSLKRITIPSSVTNIGNAAFRECKSLTSITLPSSVTSIESDAFSGCSGLTSITIPSSVTSIGGWVFEDCSSLTSINYAGTMKQWKDIYSTDLEIKSGVVVTCTDRTITIKKKR